MIVFKKNKKDSNEKFVEECLKNEQFYCKYGQSSISDLIKKLENSKNNEFLEDEVNAYL